MFEHIINLIVPSIEHFHTLGYWIAFFAALLETTIGIGLFLPGSVVILTMGALAAKGYFDIGDLIWFAVIGAMLGDNLNYYLGKKYGSAWLRKGVWFLKKEHFAKAKTFFDSHGAKSVFLGRFIPTIKEIVPFIAGTLKMERRKFFTWNVLGAIGWGIEWTLVGYIFAKSLDLAQVWLSRAGFILAILLVFLILFYILKSFIIKKGKQFFALAISLRSSIKQAIINNSEVKRFTNSHQSFFKFIKKRLDKKSFFGLPLTLLALAFIYTLSLFGGIIEDIITSDLIVAVDTRVANLLVIFRNPKLTNFFFWITMLGKWQVVIVFTLAVVGILWLYRRRLYIIPFLITIGGSETLTMIGKYVFHRPRPKTALYFEHSFSFPSGHATIAVAFYGFVTYLFLRRAKKWKTKVNLFFAGAILVLLIGFSRLYLGVHYVSDVWGGYLIGALWLIIGISISEWLNSRKKQLSKFRPTAITNFVAAIFILAAIIFYAGFAKNYNPRLLPDRAIQKDTVSRDWNFILNLMKNRDGL